MKKLKMKRFSVLGRFTDWDGDHVTFYSYVRARDPHRATVAAHRQFLRINDFPAGRLTYGSIIWLLVIRGHHRDLYKSTI